MNLIHPWLRLLYLCTCVHAYGVMKDIFRKPMRFLVNLSICSPFCV